MKLIALATAALTAVAPAHGVLYGDEIYQDVPGGKFWAFYTAGIAVIDPASCKIESYITEDHRGADLPLAFNDGIYMQNSDDSAGYILVGSRVDETDPATGDKISHMYAVSTTERKVISRAKVGYKVVHSYGVYPRNEFWMHSDGEGTFYVFDVDDLSKINHAGKDIEAKYQKPSHGKLLWDESPKLGNRGFATATGETYLFEIDLATKEQTMAFDFSSYLTEACRGLHAIAYSDRNQHVYAECSGAGGALEFDVSGGPGAIAFVQQFPEANGALYETPDGRFVVAASKGMDALFVFVPRGSGAASSVEYRVEMPGHPSTVSFYTNGDDDVVACSPLTENLNRNQWKDGNIACDYSSCTGAMSEDDVNAGVCLHDEEAPLKLMRTLAVADATHPACARCKDQANFETTTNDDGTTTTACTCTPHCGSCDPAPAYSDADSGYRCINLSAFVAAEDAGAALPAATLIPNTGGMHQGAPYGSSPECTFGRTYRTHKRGMRYDASVSNVPDHSVVIVDMERMEKKCTVNMPEGRSPMKVIYAPNKPVPRAGLVNTDMSSAAMAQSAYLALVTVGAGAALILGF